MVSGRVDDAELLRAIHAGRTEAAGEFVLRSWDGIYAHVYRLVGDVHRAEDIAQETFLRALGALNALDLSRPLRPWLLRVATRLVIDERRRARAEVPLGGSEPARANGHADLEVRQATARAIAELPSEQRSALILRVHEQWSHAQIAAVLECAESTARWHLHQARAALRKKLESYL